MHITYKEYKLADLYNSGLLSMLRQITGLLRKLCRPAYIYRLRPRSWHFLIIVSPSRGFILEVQTTSVNLQHLMCNIHVSYIHSAENLTSCQVLHIISDHFQCQASIFVKMISQSFSILLFWLLNTFWGLFSDYLNHLAALQLI